MAGGGEPGGILGLLDLIEEHRAALRYDWRARFGLGLDAVPDVIGWGEALDLVRVLRSDPSTQLAAALEGWSHPLDRVGWMLADLIDVQGASKAGKKWKPYPRPFANHGERVPGKPWEKTGGRAGDVGGRTRAEVVQLLNGLGHSLPA